MATIIVTTGDHKGDFYPLGQRTNVIGRAENVPIQILDDLVSRKHLQIRFAQEQSCYYLLDMRSKHGILLNGAAVVDETALVDGDQIQIGNTILMFTEKDFDDRESALSHFKRAGERARPTQIQ